jgi:flagella basal body P-ring formation protein FlgA
MIAFHMATLVVPTFALFIASAQASQAPVPVLIEQAARAELQRQMDASGLSEPQFEVNVTTARAAPPCGQNVAVEPVDTRFPQRMRFVARCNDTPGWRYEYAVRARITAMVAIAAAPVASNETLTNSQVTIERRDISNIADPLANPSDAVGKMSHRMLRPGDILRSGQLVSPVLVKRGDAVTMVARIEGIEVSTAGEALDAGGQGAVVRVRNAGSGQVVRMRVSGAGTVEPVDAGLNR